MHFTSDQQTLNDLTIFGKTGAMSVFGLFDKTQTQGGAARIEDMFRFPMADHAAINSRCEVLAYFTSTKIDFPFNREQFDVIEQYLKNTDERSKLPGRETSMSEKLKGMVATDPHFKNISGGVIAVRELIRELEGFFNSSVLQKMSLDYADNPVIKELECMGTLLKDTELDKLIKEKSVKSLSYAAIAEYDVILRFRKRDRIKACLYAIYQLDAYLTVAKVARERNFCYPVALSPGKQEVLIEDVYHPHVKGAVANSLEINPEGNVIFLTGANMAGKSTLMKSLGIAMYLAHMGFPIPAKAMKFSVREGIYTSINLPDNLSKGVSHFYAEVLRIKKVSQELGQNKNLFIIIDELFRGTNVKDAYEATVAITAAFAAKQNCMFVVSTHIMEAADTLRERCKNIKFVYLPTKMDGNNPIYTYRLEAGITNDRHGMIIVNNEGIIDILKNNLNKRKVKAES